jgi:DNA-binding transcriptional ArsR family regulator
MLDEYPDLRLGALASATEAYAQEAFGAQLHLDPTKLPSLPHFLLDRYCLWRAELLNEPAIFIMPKTGSIGGVEEFLKHREQLRQRLGIGLYVLVLEAVPAALRRRLIETRIAFISPGRQFYLPEAFLDLREIFSSERERPGEKLSPTAQLIVLGALQGHDMNEANLTQLADRFRTAIMSMSRALDELEALELTTRHQVGRQRRLRLRYDGAMLWHAAEGFLQSPLRKSRVITVHIPEGQAPLAAESALARYTMLAEPRIECRAVLAAFWKRIAADWDLEPASVYDENRIEVQTWTYDPLILAENGVVDRLSLYLSARLDPDERVAQAAEQLLEPLGW